MAMASTYVHSSSSPPVSSSSVHSTTSSTKKIQPLVTTSGANTNGRLVRAGSDQGPYAPLSPSSPSMSPLPSPTSPSSPSSPLSPLSTRFRFSKLLQIHRSPSNCARSHGSEQDQPQPLVQPNQQPRQQHQPFHYRHHHHPGFFSPKHSAATRLRRGGFFGFIQSHYHAFHRTQEQRTSQTSADDAALNGSMQGVRGSSSRAGFPPHSTSSSSLATSSNSTTTTTRETNSKSPHTTVHSAYNITISDFRAHATIASSRSAKTPAKVTDVVFERRAFEGGDEKMAKGSRRKKAERNMLSVPPSAATISTPALTAATRPLAAAAPCDEATDYPKRKYAETEGESGKEAVRMTSIPDMGNIGGVASSPSLTSTAGGGGGATKAPWRSLALLGLATSPPASSSASSSSSLSTTLASCVPTSKQTTSESISGKNQTPAASPSSHLSKGWEIASKKMGFKNMKKKRSLPSHYLSLPVGGTASAGTNAMYMLHSEDLSVTEFAKLAGITILPDEETSSYQESLIDSATHGYTTDQEMAQGSSSGPGSESGSTGNTLSSDKNLTFGTISTNSSIRKTNIWDPQFWSMPNRDSESQISLPGESSSYLATTPPAADAQTASTTPEHGKGLSLTPGSNPDMTSSTPLRAFYTPTLQRSGSNEERETASSGAHARRNSGFSSGLPPGSGSRGDFDEKARRADTGVKSPKDTLQISSHLGRPRSFTSFTAVAMELDGDCVKARRSSTEPSIDKKHQQHPPQQHVGIELIGPLKSSNLVSPPSQPSALPAQPASAPHQHQVPMAALHALQHHSRTKSHSPGGHHRPSGHLRSGSSAACRTRSPSPSPLSRQIEISDSDGGLDSPLEEEDEGEEDESRRCPPPRSPLALVSPNPPISKNKRSSCSHLRAEDTPWLHPTTDAAESKLKGQEQSQSHDQFGGPLNYNRTLSLPLALSDQTQAPLVPPSIPTTSTPARTAPRSFTPGTKVGRFTLVQEMCTKHVDVLKAQELQRRASLGDTGLFSSQQGANVYSGGEEKKGGLFEEYRSGVEHGRVHLSTSTPPSPSVSALSGGRSSNGSSSGDEVPLSTERFKCVSEPIKMSTPFNPMLQPEENVRVFQRKKAKRVMPTPTPPSSLRTSSMSPDAGPRPSC